MFFETPEFTGATRVTRTIAKTLQEKYEVVFAVVDPNTDNLNLRREIEKQIEKNNPEILFSSFVSINPEVIEIGKAKGLIVAIRTDYKLTGVSKERRNRIEETYPNADYLIVQTVEMGDDLREIKGVNPEKVIVIENPIDKEDISQKAAMPNPFNDNGKFHFLWVGRKDPIKDLSTLEAAFEIVNHQYPKTDLTLVSGDPNPYRWMKHADCLVISSKSEASPNVLREALFLGTPVVSTDCSPSVRKLLPGARIAQVGNPQDLAAKMISVVLSKFSIND